MLRGLRPDACAGITAPANAYDIDCQFEDAFK
jgi:hypothetical protein